MATVDLEKVKSLAEVKADAKLLAFVLAGAKRLHSDENVLFFFAKGNPEGLYPKYISSKSPQQINIDTKVKSACDKLATAEDWKNAAWPKLFDAARAEVDGLFLTDIRPKLLKTKEYAEYIRVNAAVKKAGDPAKIAKLLGIGDVTKLKKALEARAKGDTKGADKLLDEIAKEEKLKDRAAALWKSLEKSGLA